MSKRIHQDWLNAFCQYASWSEAPRHMHFWTGVCTIAGALQRKVWIDQAYFRWYPSFYVIMVAPPGIVSKSTTAGIGMDLLRQVPGIHFGPSIVTMQALVAKFAEITEAFEYNGEMHPQSALILESSEFGNLLDPRDKDMVDLLVSLWDCKKGNFDKATKHSGSDSVENPWISLIACTTPSWIAGNFPEYMIGGGFTSRCIFVYADKKAKKVAYPYLEVPENHKEMEEKLVADLVAISKLTGEFSLTPEAIQWGKQWYDELWEKRPANLDDDRFGGYIARKQTHLHKLAMVMSASESGRLEIRPDHLSVANEMLIDLEPDMAMVFSKIGKTDASVYMDRAVDFVRKSRIVAYDAFYRHVHSYFPSMRDFEDMLAGCIRAGFLQTVTKDGVTYIVPGSVKASVGVIHAVQSAANL